MRNEGTRWFRRFYKFCKNLSPHLKFKRAKHGFYRIYWTGGGVPAYVHEVDKNMPLNGYKIYEKDIRLVSKRYYEELEDNDEVVRKIKNYKEGYWDSVDTIKKRVFMMRNDDEFLDTARDAFTRVRVK